MAKYITHAGHPHPLELREGTESEFLCGLCFCRGYGFFYRCPSCDFRVHDTCAACPETFAFFGHPQHPLALHPMVVGRCCALCRFCIRGIHYGCRLCGVFLHPVCATLPPAAVSPAHPLHLVTLVPSRGSVWKKCASCDDVPVGSTEEGWHYVCAPCGVRLHPWCLLGDAVVEAHHVCAPCGVRLHLHPWCLLGGDGGEDNENAPLCIRGPVL